MQVIIASFLIMISWYLNAFIDAIDFGKVDRSRNVYELWHLVKFFSYAIPYTYILFIVSAPLWLYPVLAALGYTRIFVYKAARMENVYQWDNDWDVPWLRKIMRVSR